MCIRDRRDSGDRYGPMEWAQISVDIRIFLQRSDDARVPFGSVRFPERAAAAMAAGAAAEAGAVGDEWATTDGRTDEPGRDLSRIAVMSGTLWRKDNTRRRPLQMTTEKND